MKTSELTGAQLDYWTARADGIPAEELSIQPVQRGTELICVRTWKPGVLPCVAALQYSTAWHQGGPLVEKHGVNLAERRVGWKATTDLGIGIGGTPLQAICRAVVRAAFGDEVDEVLA